MHNDSEWLIGLKQKQNSKHFFSLFAECYSRQLSTFRLIWLLSEGFALKCQESTEGLNPAKFDFNQTESKLNLRQYF